MKRSRMAKLVDRMCELHPEYENLHDTRVSFCNEFLQTVKEMQGTELEPYLAEIGVMGHKDCFDGCFHIGFKIPLVSYEQLRELQSKS